jgi:hypothetical protein
MESWQSLILRLGNQILQVGDALVPIRRRCRFKFGRDAPARCILARLAKGTGLVFVSNQRTNNLIVIDPKTNTVVLDLKTSRHGLQCQPHQTLCGGRR